MASSIRSRREPFRLAPGSASSPSTIATSSRPGPTSASSRFMRKTTWAPAARRTAILTAHPRRLSAVAAWRRPVDRRGRPLDTRPSGAAQGADRALRAGAVLRASRLVDARAASISTICCRCPIPTETLRASCDHVDEVQDGARPPDAAGEPVDLCGLRRERR